MGEQKKLICDPELEYLLKAYTVFEDKGGYPCITVNGRKTTLHSLVKPLQGTGRDIDHINRNKWDCRRENLRKATRSINSFNKDLQKNNSSGYPGIYYYEGKDVWIAQGTYQNRRTTLGTYAHKETAVRAKMEWFLEHGIEVPHCDDFPELREEVLRIYSKKALTVVDDILALIS